MRMSETRSALRLTRRRWTSLLALMPAVMRVSAQVTTTVPPAGVPKPAPAAAPVQQAERKAFDEIRQTSERLAAIEVPMNVEPAFSFRA